MKITCIAAANVEMARHNRGLASARFQPDQEGIRRRIAPLVRPVTAAAADGLPYSG